MARNRHLVPLAVMCLTAALGIGHAEAHTGPGMEPNGRHYEGIEPEFETDDPPICASERDITSSVPLPRYRFFNPLEANQTGSHCGPLYNDYVQYALVYKIEDGVAPHPLAFRYDFVGLGDSHTINLNDDGLGLGEYEIYYFSKRTSVGSTNPGIFHASATVSYDTLIDSMLTANAAVIPPPPVFTSPGNNSRLSATDQTIAGTALTGLDVRLTVASVDNPAAAERNYRISNGDDPAWSQDVDLYDGENRLTAIAVKGDLRSAPAVLTVVVDGTVEPPVITFPANGTTFDSGRNDQSVRGTATEGVVTLNVTSLTGDREMATRTYDVTRQSNGTWVQPVMLYNGTNRLVATATANDIRSAPSDEVIVTVSDQTCFTNVSGDLNFGDMKVGDTSPDQTLTLLNTGGAQSAHKIEGTDWAEPGSPGSAKMNVGQTRYSGTQGEDHGSMTALTKSAADLPGTLQPGASDEIYLKLKIDLIDAGFAGALQQTVTVTGTCG